jgi:hypothetical protein
MPGWFRRPARGVGDIALLGGAAETLKAQRAGYAFEKARSALPAPFAQPDGFVVAAGIDRSTRD